MTKKILIVLIASIAGAISAQTTTSATDRGRNIIVVTSDGLRWQEVFRGADPEMMTPENEVKHPKALLAKYDGDTTEVRRAKLMPFLWSYVAKHGQLYGNRDVGSVDHVTNNMWFSYPGYNEMLTGSPDDAHINSNKKVPNPNVTVFEWLARKPEIHGSAAAFSAWRVHDSIFNSERCGFPVDAGGHQFHPPGDLTCGMQMVNRIRADIPFPWNDEVYDAVVYPMFTEYLQSRKPRATFLGFIETDAWGHHANYGEYLTSAHRVDQYLKDLWDMVQSMPEYRDNTTIIFTCDHGRGDKRQSPTAWHGHAKAKGIKHSDAIFMAIWGPDTPPKGEKTPGEITQSQTAATIAKAMGFDYNADHPKAAQPVPGAIEGKPSKAD